MFKFNSNYWGLIIGGSSGFGLATAQKLAKHGMNLCIVHRDRRGAMSRIEPSFEAIRNTGVEVITINTDALSASGRERVLTNLSERLGENGRIRMLLHSVAFGNLKLLAPYVSQAHSPENAVSRDHPESMMESPSEQAMEYNNDLFLDKDEDFARTIQAMGSNIVEWVQNIHNRKMFTDDARVLSLTSEGNRVAWRGYGAVSAAKAVLESVSRSMAVEFAPYGIRSNVIQAGVTDTPAFRVIPGNGRIREKALNRNPFGRLTQTGDVADFVYLLCTDEAAWVNGALICVDGGESIG